MPTRLEVLRNLSFGHRIAEDEAKNLAKYFVETEQWRTIFEGRADIVYGSKGAGKSAIYALLQDKEGELSKRGIILTSAEEPRGDTVFTDLVNEPPTSEVEFVNLWKLYLLSLVGKLLKEYAPDDIDAAKVLTSLERIGLMPKTGGLRALLRTAAQYVRQLPEAIQFDLKLDPLTSAPSGIGGKIVFRDPTDEETDGGFVGIDELFKRADDVLGRIPAVVWILLDRLDIAFADSVELEANALRALFKVYRSFAQREHIRLKIFLRTDIWSRITKDRGFREGSHITQTTTLTWSRPALVNLIVRRAIQSKTLLDSCGLSYEEALAHQDKILDSVFPEQVDIGPNKSKTIDWILSRTRDGSSQNAPRELIHFLEASREAEIKRIELGEGADEKVFLSRQAIREALPVVSSFRLNGTIYSEFPDLRKYIDALTGEKSLQSVQTLSTLWKTSEEQTLQTADELTEIGFFEKGGSKEYPEFKVPFLYRSALGITQGTAE